MSEESEGGLEDSEELRTSPAVRAFRRVLCRPSLIVLKCKDTTRPTPLVIYCHLASRKSAKICA